MVIFRIDETRKDVNAKYFYYFLKSPIFKNQVLSHSSGSAQPQLPIKDLKLIEITLPPFETQRRIADILSALDDKIELNRQTNATLEAIARVIFKEWFVDFNFPNTTGEMVESELGLIPSGWRAGKLGKVCELAYGKGMKAENRIEGEFPVVGSNGIVGTHNEYLVDGPGIVIGRKGTIGEVFWVHKNFYPIDTTFYIKDLVGVEGLYFHYFLLKGQDFKKIASDSAVPGLNRNQAYDNFVVIPPAEIINQFSEKMIPIFEKIDNNEQQTVNLVHLRDALLSKLMSRGLL
jgi:type I restriction enzyme S subunit